MITDSPYRSQELVLTSRAGVCAGLMAASMMLVLLVILQPLSGLSYSEVLEQAGAVLLPASDPSFTSSMRIVVGLVLHLSLGALFGILYAACQQDVPIRGLIAVGVFYGFVLWIAGRFLVSPFVGEGLRMTVRSRPWLLACLLYGVCLMAAAVWANKRRLARDGRTEPID